MAVKAAQLACAFDQQGFKVVVGVLVPAQSPLFCLQALAAAIGGVGCFGVRALGAGVGDFLTVLKPKPQGFLAVVLLD